MFLYLLLILELTQQAALVNFVLHLNIFKILKKKSHFEHSEGKIAYILPSKIAQCKQP